MSMRRISLLIFSFLAISLLPLGGYSALANPAETPGVTNGAAADRLKQRAERVQQRRKTRISQQDRQAAAERAKAAREGGAAQKAAPEQGGKGVAK